MLLAISIENLDFKSALITVVGMLVVFLALALLVVVFTSVPRIGRFFKKLGINGGNGHNHASNGHSIHSETKKVATHSNIPAGDSAVIAAAVYLYLSEIHDNENRVMTIKRVSRNYSPWNSKIYGVNWFRNR